MDLWLVFRLATTVGCVDFEASAGGVLHRRFGVATVARRGNRDQP
jgi:hypothetical protein